MSPAAHVSDERPPSVDRVPTLTEVVDFGPVAVPEDLRAGTDTPPPAVAVPPVAPLPSVAPDPEQLVTQVLSELSPRIEMLLESRLREALAPALARAAEALIRESRDGLNRTLRELVEEAVTRALQRRDVD